MMHCANCDTALAGEFCHGCGQSAHVHRSIGHVFEEFLHGVWHFDSKAWRTLPLLIFRPGRLTHDYIHGHRARYIAPLALFLLSVFLMFFVFGLLGGSQIGNVVNASGNRVGSSREAVASIRTQIANDENALANLSSAAGRRAAEQELAVKRVALGVAEANLRLATSDKGERTWSDEVADAARAGNIKIKSGLPGVDANIVKALQNPDFALYRVEQKAYKLSFLLVPLSLPVLWLMFCWRRDATIYDHTVFALYSLSFMSLLLIVVALLFKLDGAEEGLLSTLAGFLLLAPPVHMFAQLRGTYRLSTGGALVRTAVLLLSTGLVLSLFFALIVVLGLAD